MIKFIINQIKIRAQFFKYCIGGGTSFVVDFALLYILTEYAGLWYLSSATIAFAVAVLVNYFIQKFWTFKSKQSAGFRQFLMFGAVQIVGLFINNTTLYFMVESIGLWYMFSKAIAAIIVLIWNFWASKMFVFNEKFINRKNQIILAGEIFPPDIGGPATFTHHLARYLEDNDHDLRIICYSTVLLRKRDEEFGNRITRISSFLPIPIKYLIYFFNLFTLSLSIFPRVIYAQGPVASGLPAILVGTLLRKRVVIKVVGDYSWEQTRLYHATERSIDDWQKERVYNSKNFLINWKLKFITRLQFFVVRHADAIIVPSHYLKSLVVGWGAKEHKIKVVYNSFSFGKKPNITTTEAKKRINVKGDIMITVCRLVPWKGLDMLIDIMPELLKVNKNFKLIIVGSGPEEKRLQEVVKRKKLSDSVIMSGRIDHEELRYYYLAASLFVLNSSYEGLSHVILDAMHYNLAVIASDVGGNPELIQDDYNGCLVGYNNKTEWIESITRLWQNKSIRDRFCASPLVKLDVFSFDHMVRDTIKVLFNQYKNYGK
jgi:glycosyltransferase involved in cell wall biosynthesis/putative flippase GtrA